MIAGGFKAQWTSLSVAEQQEALRPFAEDFERRLESARRAQWLSAYRLRAKWRKADLAKLKELGLKHGKYRMQRIAKIRSQRGRGVVADPTLLADRALELLKVWEPCTTFSQRRQILRATRWWSELVEAAYRGELEEERARKRTSAKRNEFLFQYEGYRSINAAKTVGKAICASRQGVSQFCKEARSRYKLGTSSPSPAIRANVLAHLLRTGELPE